MQSRASHPCMFLIGVAPLRLLWALRGTLQHLCIFFQVLSGMFTITVIHWEGMRKRKVGKLVREVIVVFFVCVELDVNGGFAWGAKRWTLLLGA